MILQKKHGSRDLVVINYRLEGLAANFHETQETMLANLAKVRVRSDKVQARARLKGPNRSRGFPANLVRHKQNYEKYRIF